jgi:hypothetical protein
MFKGQAPPEDFEKEELNRLVLTVLRRAEINFKELLELQSRIGELKASSKKHGKIRIKKMKVPNL